MTESENRTDGQYFKDWVVPVEKLPNFKLHFEQPTEDGNRGGFGLALGVVVVRLFLCFFVRVVGLFVCLFVCFFFVRVVVLFVFLGGGGIDTRLDGKVFAL